MLTKIPKRVEDLLADPNQPSDDSVKELIDRLRKNQDDAVSSSVTSLYLLLATWIASVAVAYGFISEAEVASLKISSVKSILVITPIAIGFEYYLMASALTWQAMIRKTVDEIYKNRFAKLCDSSLTSLLDPPTFMNMEAFLTLPANSDGSLLSMLNNFWYQMMTLVVVLGGPLVVAHSVVLIVRYSGVSHVWIAIGIALGVLPAIRGFLLLFSVQRILKK